MLALLIGAVVLAATPTAGLSAGGPTITASLTDAPDPVTTDKPLRGAAVAHRAAGCALEASPAETFARPCSNPARPRRGEFVVPNEP